MLRRILETIGTSAFGFVILIAAGFALHLTIESGSEGWKMLLVLVACTIWCACQVLAIMIASGSEVLSSLSKK